ncbi:multiple cyclophane-containing RiPP AmcA [Asanoa sp. NPDC049518]|uniref:multiple cyclophane-containing RiPP AmcA n=1 Tax=unclassified Asanoa TaxID=2685164 RepID=UPI0034360019
MPETTSLRPSDQLESGAGAEDDADDLTERVAGARAGLIALLSEAEQARRSRAEAADPAGGAVCAWNHFENIPTFYNWNNRPR